MAKNKIELYTSENCDYCNKVKEILKENKLKFTEKDTKENSGDWGKIIGLVGLAITPTFVVNEEHYFIPGRDYNDPKPFVDFLKNTKVEFNKDFSTDVMLLQSLKTMTYSVNKFFLKLNQDLEMLKQTNNVNKSTD